MLPVLRSLRTTPSPPSFTFSPTNASINFSAVGNIIITFNETIRNLDNSPITPAAIQAGLVELKETNNGGTAVPFTATFNGTNTITINPNSTLLHNQVYYVEMNPVEDAVDNATVADDITFTTENRPNISAFIPAAAERCIGDNVTINGSRFTGTGNPLSGNSQPTVYIDGAAVAPGNIISFNSTQIVFTLPIVTIGDNRQIKVKNNDSDLESIESDFDIREAIDVTLPAIPATLNPAQNTNVNVAMNPSQSSNYNYALILTTAPGGYGTAPGTVHSANGNGSNLTLNTANGPADNFNIIGDYTYRVDVSRTNCVTKTLSNTPFTLTVAALSVNVSATDVSVCQGSSTTLIGAVTGGTGFYQFRWTSTPAGYSSSSSSPTVTPPSNIRYNLEVEDNAGNIVTDFVDVVVNPVPSATFIPNPGIPPFIPAETSVRVNYVVEDRDYLVSGSPAGGEFTGQGTIKKSDGKYYFNPANAGLGNYHQIVYIYK
ncbi:MAG: Ig-like domain-containing protein [Flammeovirgaceae bacterium]|nr:Ig-like domain-containing protein [Flammeovirgaceae bacterium]